MEVPGQCGVGLTGCIRHEVFLVSYSDFKVINRIGRIRLIANITKMIPKFPKASYFPS